MQNFGPYSSEQSKKKSYLPKLKREAGSLCQNIRTDMHTRKKKIGPSQAQNKKKSFTQEKLLREIKFQSALFDLQISVPKPISARRIALPDWETFKWVPS